MRSSSTQKRLFIGKYETIEGKILIIITITSLNKLLHIKGSPFKSTTLESPLASNVLKVYKLESRVQFPKDKRRVHGRCNPVFLVPILSQQREGSLFSSRLLLCSRLCHLQRHNLKIRQQPQLKGIDAIHMQS